MSVERFVSFGTELVVAAGAELLGHFGEVDATAKGRFDIVTEADRAVEDFMLKEIRREFPDHRQIAEESAPQLVSGTDGYCWVIDPLDGTVNFAAGVPCFSVSLALMVDGDPLVAWVYDPVRDELFHAVRSRGSFVNGRPVHGRMVPGPAPLIGVSSGFLSLSRSDRHGPTAQIIERFGKVRIMGSQALHLSYVGAGRLDAAVSWEARVWDDAAGALIATESGASYSTFWGESVFPLSSGSRSLAGHSLHSVAAAASVADQLMPLLATVGRRMPGR